MKFSKVISLLLFFCFSFYDAQELHQVKLNQFRNSYTQDYKNDTLSLKIENPLSCPLRIRVFFGLFKKRKFN